MTDLERFLRYMQAFEYACALDDWSGLAAYFDEDASFRVEGGGPFGTGASGAREIVDGLRTSVTRVDRRFDVRIAEVLEGPCTRADGIWMRYALTLRRAGLPELRVEGEHRTRFAGARIAAIDDRLGGGDGERVAAYLAEHDARLRPVGGPYAPHASQLDLEHLRAATQRTLVRCYANAKSEQDIGAALVVCSEDFELEATSLPFATRGLEKAARQLTHFFRAFPDFAGTGEGMAVADDAITLWGRARMTMAGDWLGHAATGKTADYPFFCVFGFANGKLTGERFFFDCATLCEQFGLPAEAFAATLRRLDPSRVASAAAAPR